ncbi:hypothetical protein Pan216_18040 [Planctomycetes bacterium Pan216]|uniref:DUF559 domain-containing protein n=1 Tax=Kolteria novifilia TaxID=2527975 RepID=A0A518B1U3_9BACT|nr:hypothetical protein Pan216_18040 [Planctomycetes bacterium Pan216]
MIDPRILTFARELRREQTDAEELLWKLLRDRRFGGVKFRRQHPVDSYILDFYAHKHRIAIELDGGQHNSDPERRRDDKRSAHLRNQGIHVLRFWNHDVFQQTDAVLTTIWNTLEEAGAFEGAE